MRARVSRKWRPMLAGLAAAALIAGCSSDATGPAPQPQPQPEPGQLRVTVVPTAGSAGAVVLHVTGPSISSPTASGGTDVYNDLTDGVLKAVVVGTSLAGEVLRFSVPDVRDASSYSVTVQQAAGNDNEPLAASGVTAEVVRLP